MHVGEIPVVSPLLEEIAQIDDIGTLDRRRVVPDLEPGYVALQQEGDDAEIAVGADAALQAVGVGGLGWVMQEFVKGRGGGAEGVEEALAVAEGDGDGFEDFLGELGYLLQVLHACLAEVGAHWFGLEVGSVGEFLV